jgi:hypothetical protein
MSKNIKGTIFHGKKIASKVYFDGRSLDSDEREELIDILKNHFKFDKDNLQKMKDQDLAKKYLDELKRREEEGEDTIIIED